MEISEPSQTTHMIQDLALFFLYTRCTREGMAISFCGKVTSTIGYVYFLFYAGFLGLGHFRRIRPHIASY